MVQDAAPRASDAVSEAQFTALTGSKSDAVQVAVRVRPLSANEASQGSESCVDVEDASVLLAEKRFDFDAAFPATTEQNDVYTTLVAPMIDQFFDGYHATVFAYGQTGSGKTYTMGNDFTATESTAERGVIPRVVQNIFKRIQKSATPHHFVLKLSYLEILNEEICDLLATRTPTTAGLAIHGDTDRGIVVSGLSEHIVSSVDQAGEFLCSGALLRATASTSMNAHSSRSHAICTFIMEQYGVSAVEGGMETRRSKFHLVDLAGSERVHRMNAEGARLKEGININLGLLALGNVINALCERNRTNSTVHIPYRGSKLTRLLQDSLGGNSKTVMIACISPADSNYEETSNTLRFASRTRKIENQAVINKERNAENELAYLKQQVEILQLDLLQHKQGMKNCSGSIKSEGSVVASGELEGDRSLEAENRKLREEVLLAVTEKEKWKRIANEFMSQSGFQKNAESESRSSTTSQVKLSMSVKKNTPDEDTQGGKSSQLSRLEQLRKFQAQKLPPQRSKEFTAVKRKAKDSVFTSKRSRTLASPSTTPSNGGNTMNTRRVSVPPSAAPTKRSSVGDSEALTIGAITQLIQQVLASHEAIYSAKEAVRVHLADRKALALEISQMEEESSVENSKKLVMLRADHRNKSDNIRLLQQKIVNIERTVSLPSELFPVTLETCHDLVRHLIDTLVGCKEDLSNCRFELITANEKILTQQEAHDKRTQALETKLTDTMKELQLLEEKLTKKTINKRKKARESYETMEMLFSSSDEEEDNRKADPDYVEKAGIRKERNEGKRGVSKAASTASVNGLDEIKERLEVSTTSCCACHGKCARKACACKSQSRVCNNECSCNSSKCRNRGGDPDTALGAVLPNTERTSTNVVPSTPERDLAPIQTSIIRRQLHT